MKILEGDAMISKTHCNFFINNGKARSSDIERLIKKLKKVVEKQVNLELEIKIIGEEEKIKKVLIVLVEIQVRER